MSRLKNLLNTWQKTSQNVTKEKKNHRASPTFTWILQLVFKTLLNRGLPQKALRLLEKTKQPQNTWPLIQSLAATGKIKKAYTLAAKQATRNPLDPSTTCRLAALAEQKEAFSTAQKLAYRALILDPYSPCGPKLLATWAVKRKSWGEAEDWLTWLVATHSHRGFQNNKHRYLLAQLYMRIKEPSITWELFKGDLNDKASSSGKKAATQIWKLLKQTTK